MNTLTSTQVQEAQAKIASRRSQAVCRIQSLESGLTKRLVDHAMGIITADELNADAAELVLCREIANEDTTEATAYFNRIAQEISARARAEQNRIETLSGRRSFALLWNELVSSTSGFSLDDVSKLRSIRTTDVTGPEWHRFETMRPSFGSQPEGVMTFSEYANVPLIDLDSIV